MSARRNWRAWKARVGTVVQALQKRTVVGGRVPKVILSAARHGVLGDWHPLWALGWWCAYQLVEAVGVCVLQPELVLHPTLVSLHTQQRGPAEVILARDFVVGQVRREVKPSKLRRAAHGFQGP